MDFWLWIERLAHLSIFLITLKRVTEYFAPFLLTYFLSFILKKQQIVSSEGAGPEDQNQTEPLLGLLELLGKALQTLISSVQNPPTTKKIKNKHQ